MKRIIMKVSLFLLIVSVVSVFFVPAQDVQAKGKTVHYYADDWNEMGAWIKKIDIKKDKLIIWGSLIKTDGKKETKLKCKKRTFRLSKKAKITIAAGLRVPKKNWKSVVNDWGKGFDITVKNGKVTKIMMYD